MQMHEVHTETDKRRFREVAIQMYRNDPNWIRPLDKDIEEVFDKDKNKTFRHGECMRWILTDDKGKDIGRIAAFVNKKYKEEQPTGGVGFFECINDQEAANYMFDRCKQWLTERGMEAMDGSINFGERDSWWGVQIEGFQEPLYKMNYNPPYYKDLFEAYGFQTFYDQLCFSLKVKNRLQEKFYHAHEEISKDPDFKTVHIKKSELDKFSHDFATIYNNAWAQHMGGKQIEVRTINKMMQAMKPVMDEEIMWFTYYKDEPIAFWINLPDLNQYFKHFNGKLGLMEKLRLLWMKSFKKPKRFTGLVFGVVPKFQGKGVDGYMIIEAATVIQGKMLYDDYEMQWIGDWNPRMINIAENLGTHVSRKLRTYRYLFDRTKEFKRHPVVG
ncbi:MAG: hypothetical protein H6551_00210 [Chitinophagales bacterium]|nr:hypothetical protein [Chitinophagaceae bacterium]MCB9063544.1 hypothetical protein [Chitinophagales bacterium]